MEGKKRESGTKEVFMKEGRTSAVSMPSKGEGKKEEGRRKKPTTAYRYRPPVAFPNHSASQSR